GQLLHAGVEGVAETELHEHEEAGEGDPEAGGHQPQPVAGELAPGEARGEGGGAHWNRTRTSALIRCRTASAAPCSSRARTSITRSSRSREGSAKKRRLFFTRW